MTWNFGISASSPSQTREGGPKSPHLRRQIGYPRPGGADAFAAERSLRTAPRYVENESGATLDRPELLRLLANSKPGDVLLTEQIDRLSRLTDEDWRRLRTEIDARQVRIVALDLPTSWSLAKPNDEFTGRMLAAVNSILLDMLAAIARKDYVDRRRRQAEGTAKARDAGRYKGRPEDEHRNAGIATMLQAGKPWAQIQGAFGCSRDTIARVRKRLDAPAPVLAVRLPPPKAGIITTVR